MKFSSTMTLALVLAAGMAAAASAQTVPGAASEPKSSIAKPQTGSMPSMQGLNDSKAMDNKGASSAQLKSEDPKAKSVELKSEQPKAKSAEMKATQPRAKRIAHVKAIHQKRVAHLRHPAMHGQNFAQAQKSSPDQVKGAQEQLKSAGLYNGPTDGMMDPDTRAALARYQQQNGLRATQTLDQRTLARLNSGQTSGVGSSAPSGNQGASAPPSAGGMTGQQPINR
jgi:putative peptidoglycan binding protein